MHISDVISDADKVRAENFQDTPPIDVYDIARNNGLDIVEKYFPPNQANIAGFVTRQDGRGKLYVNLADSSNRRRFTVAHELGHWRLHKQELENNPNRSILFRIAIGQLNKDPIEKDANIYAANLLVPLSLLEACRQGKSKEQLAEMFGVSTEVMGYRLSLLEKTEDVRQEKQS
jgi:Zn-dependent peptidase ImmA (M78 family)